MTNLRKRRQSDFKAVNEILSRQRQSQVNEFKLWHTHVCGQTEFPYTHGTACEAQQRAMLAKHNDEVGKPPKLVASPLT